MFCQNCGAAMTGRFCASCGAPATAPQQAPVYTPAAIQPVTYVPAPQPQAPAKPPVPGRGFGIASMIMGFASIHCLLIVPYMMLAVMAGTPNFLRYDSLMRATVGFTLAIYVVLPILGIVFSRNAMKKGYICRMSKSGMIMSLISLLGFIPALLLILFN